MNTDFRAELQRLVKAYDEHGGRWPDHHAQALFQAADRARRVLEAQPEPVATDEELCKVLYQAICEFPPTNPDAVDLNADQYELELEIRKARAVITHYAHPTIQPVPVSERLPGPEDCDAEGRCWVFDDMLGLPSWTLIKVLGEKLEPDMTWLPHHALPTPTP